MIIKILLAVILGLFSAELAFSADIEARIGMLEEALKSQQETIEEQQRLINRLKQETSALRKQESDSAGQEKPAKISDQNHNSEDDKGQSLTVTGAFGDFFKNLRSPAITLTLNSFYYSGSEGNPKTRGITGFSSVGLDQKKGFNIDEASIAMFAPVDQYFDLFGVFSFTEEEASIEEAYFYTKSLPVHLRLKAGKFKSNFSVHNELHPHDWDFADTPLAYRGFMGTDGIMEKGAQLTYRPPLPLSPFFGVELLQGENSVIFDQSSSSGPNAFTAYAKASYDFDKSSNVYFGPYVIRGKTRTDSVAEATFFRGESTLYGFETLYKRAFSKDSSLTVQGEYMWRTQAGNLLGFAGSSGGRLTRSQDGMYLQALYQMDRWRLGARYDRLALCTDEFKVAGTQQNFPSPWRATAALEFNPSEYARFRLQYNYDRSGGGSISYGGGSRTNHEIYLQMVFSIGTHMEPKGQRD